MEFLKRKLDRSIPVPLYYQLKTMLEEYIAKEHPDPSLPIPTEMEISEAFNVSRPTVRQAINELVVEGKLVRQKSKGTFITQPKIPQDFLMTIESFNEEMRAKGLEPSTKVLSLDQRTALPEECEKLKIPAASPVICLERCRYADGKPVVRVITVLPAASCAALLDEDLTRDSLYFILENKLGLKISYATRELEAIGATPATARLLEIPEGAPVQFIRTITYLEDGTPIEYSKANYRGDRSQFLFVLKRNPS